MLETLEPYENFVQEAQRAALRGWYAELGQCRQAPECPTPLVINVVCAATEQSGCDGPRRELAMGRDHIRLVD